MMKTFGRIVTIFCFACVVCMVSGNHGGRSDETKVVQRKRRDYDYHLLHMMTNLQRQIRAVEKEMKKRQSGFILSEKPLYHQPSVSSQKE
ncbi:uncharacterized protein [Magallana gigas]|uniref:uncharacterized protein isoform X4 n=1 Tax=Magallana gigas TaxID=29159 RepID=UPI00333EBEA4